MDGQVTDMEGHVRPLGAAISRREWSEVEAAHAALRDRARIGAVSDAELSAMERAIERMGWPEIHGFEAELFRGQDIHEDAGGYLMRAIRALFGLPPKRSRIETYRDAARALVRRAA